MKKKSLSFQTHHLVGIETLNLIADLAPERRIVIARKLIAEGKTLAEMAKPLGYSNVYQVARFIKAHGLKTNPLNKGQHHQYTEIEKAQRAEAMKSWHQNHPVHQNVWQKKRVTNEEAAMPVKDTAERDAKIRQRHADGVKVELIAKEFGLSRARVFQLVQPDYEKWQEGNRKRLRELNERFKALPEAERKAVYQERKDAKARKLLEKEGIMPDRVFELSKPNDLHDTRNAVRIVCASCSKQAKFLRHGAISNIHAATFFHNRGWHVGNGPRNDKCPDCLKKATEIKREKPMIAEPVSNGQAKEPVKDFKEMAAAFLEKKAPPPVPPVATVVSSELVYKNVGEPTRSDRRIIHNKLDDVYGDETTGYKDDWTDAKVASDLGVPVQWVSAIRESDFGPDINAAVKAAEMEKVKAAALDVKAMAERVTGALAALDVARGDFNNSLAVFNEAYQKISG